MILLLFLSQAGYYFFYTVRLSQVREEMKERLCANLPVSSLELIIQDNKTISWQEPGREFYLDGRLYDVAMRKMVNGKIWLYCINDKKEGQLVQDIAKMVRSSGDNNTDGKTGRQMLKLQLNDYIVHSIEKIIHIAQNEKQQYFDFDASTPSAIAEVTVPPPRA